MKKKSGIPVPMCSTIESEFRILEFSGRNLGFLLMRARGMMIILRARLLLERKCVCFLIV